MEMKEGLVFNDTSWHYIEQLLPNDENIKLAVLQDFMWFFNRNIKYKSNQRTIDDYIRHLELKANPKVNRMSDIENAFKKVDVKGIKSQLLNIYVKVYEC